MHHAVAEGDDDDAYEWEIRDSQTPFWQHAVAGSAAGVMEHVGMFPIDTVKTRMQASPVKMSVPETVQLVLKERGLLGLMRGSTVIGFGCIPAHIAFFGTFELSKEALIGNNRGLHEPAAAACCGALASVAHDVIITPTDVVKQRLQMGGYSGTLDCIMSISRKEGVGAFYRSLPTTVAMNIPFSGVLVASNESLKKLLNVGGANGRGAHWYFLVAGVSGAVAATATLPFDVVKTHQQTFDGSQGGRYEGVRSTIQGIYARDGYQGFFRGLGPRIALAMPSAAISWGTYEMVRMLLRSFYGDTTGGSGAASSSSSSSSSLRSESSASSSSRTGGAVSRAATDVPSIRSNFMSSGLSHASFSRFSDGLSRFRLSVQLEPARTSFFPNLALLQ